MVRSGLVKGDYDIWTAGLRFGMSGRNQVDIAVDAGADAILLKSNGLFPYPALRDPIRRANAAGIPVFLPDAGSFSDFGVQRKIALAENDGLTALRVDPGQHFVVQQGIERIFDQEPTLEGRRSVSKDLFDQPRFFEKPAFLDLMMNPALKNYADSLTLDDGPIVIDCGHIDSPNGKPTDEDYTSFEEGIVLMRYLQHKGHQDVKIGFLLNEMYTLEQFDKKGARQRISRARKQRKREGISADIHRVYGQTLYGYGVTREQWPKLLTMSFEGSLSLETRQELSKYEKGEDHPFQVELDEHGDAGYSFATKIEGRPFERVISSAERGAPVCSLMSAKLNERYNRGDVRTLIYLRDVKWRSAIKCGARSARVLYGTDLNMFGAFYQTKNGKVSIVEHGQI
ncbi:sugar ABC transporter substrate-binding protein [archaeon]|nr:sugar ABC transporter substrate-binding protein [archaeon]MBT6698703.1 sugar ABC transporter substrate-binding protein [archaeon]